MTVPISASGFQGEQPLGLDQRRSGKSAIASCNLGIRLGSVGVAGGYAVTESCRPERSRDLAPPGVELEPSGGRWGEARGVPQGVPTVGVIRQCRTVTDVANPTV